MTSIAIINPLFSRRRGARVTARNWRIICPCQRHRPALFGSAVRARRAFMLAGSLAVLSASVPVDAFETVVRAPELRELARIEVPAVEARATSGALPFVEPGQPLEAPAALPSPLLIDTAREQFFRTEIPFGEIIYREALRANLSPELVAAIVKAESDFRPRLVSNKNAHGLMQVLPSTAELMGVTDVMDPVENIRAGTRYLRYLETQFDDPSMVLAAYNAGPTRVREFGGIPPFRETRDYVRRVNSSRREYERRIGERLAALAQ
ncbi:MAG: lytic transglycosylase domain-containing protein [Thermoanaerobaculia bacterium]